MPRVSDCFVTDATKEEVTAALLRLHAQGVTGYDAAMSALLTAGARALASTNQQGEHHGQKKDAAARQQDRPLQAQKVKPGRAPKVKRAT